MTVEDGIIEADYHEILDIHNEKVYKFRDNFILCTILSF